MASPHQKNLRKGRKSLPFHVYYVTKCLFDKSYPVLANEANANILISSLDWLRKQEIIKIGGFVVMPDHYHAIIGLTEKKTLGQVMESLDKFTARRINSFLNNKGKFWQEGFFDHCNRNLVEYRGTLEYIHQNPVRKGLVEIAENWPYSTANPQYTDWIDWKWFGIIFP